MTTSSPWRRRSGLVVARSPQASRAPGFLDGAQVLALVESDPEAPDSVAITVATDDTDRVAVLDAAGSAVVPGPLLGDLVAALARECRAFVFVDDVSADETGSDDAGEEPDDDPFDPEIDVESAMVADRAVVLTPSPLADLEALATAVGTRLWAVPHDGGAHLVLIEHGSLLADLEWQAVHLPAVLLEQGAVFPSVAIVAADGHTQRFTWDVEHQVVPAAEASAETVGAFVDAELGAGALVRELEELHPGLDTSRVRAALEQTSAHGPAAMVDALGLPAVVTAFLVREKGADQVPGAVAVDPVSVSEQVRRAAHSAAEDARRAAHAAAEDARANAEQVRRAAHAAAEDARAGAHALYESAEEASRSWVPATVAGAELVLGLLLVRRAGRTRRAGGAATAGERVLAVVGSLVLASAVLNGAVATVPRLRTYLAQR